MNKLARKGKREGYTDNMLSQLPNNLQSIRLYRKREPNTKTYIMPWNSFQENCYLPCLFLLIETFGETNRALRIDLDFCITCCRGCVGGRCATSLRIEVVYASLSLPGVFSRTGLPYNQVTPRSVESVGSELDRVPVGSGRNGDRMVDSQ